MTVKDSGGAVIRESNYTYDPFDKRIGVSVDPDGDGPEVATERWTVYDGAHPYADFDGQGTLTERYLYGPAVDMIMARLDSPGDVAWYLTDHLGSVRDLADTSGQLIDHIQYDPFGNVLAETNPAEGDRFKFTAREFDDSTGLYYYRARYYDPVAGRFISPDPIEFEGGDLNLYRYVGNSPINATDPEGQKVYWGDRDMSGAAVVGNHHMIVVVPDDPTKFSGLIDLGEGRSGFTVGAFNESGRLKVRFNEKNDREAVAEKLTGESKHTLWDWDCELHEVKPPKGMSDTAFISKIIKGAKNYMTNEEASNVDYDLEDRNCATWVNTLLKTIGVSEPERHKVGEFSGWDWGEEDLLDESLFHPPPPKPKAPTPRMGSGRQIP